MQTYTTYTLTIKYNDKETKSIDYNFDSRFELEKAYELAFDKFREVVKDKADMCAVLRLTKCFYTVSLTRSIYIDNKLSDKEVMRTIKLKN